MKYVCDHAAICSDVHCRHHAAHRLCRSYTGALCTVSEWCHALNANSRCIPCEAILPTIDEFIGSDPDFTGGQSTKEYIEEMRS